MLLPVRWVAYSVILVEARSRIQEAWASARPLSRAFSRVEEVYSVVLTLRQILRVDLHLGSKHLARVVPSDNLPSQVLGSLVREPVLGLVEVRSAALKRQASVVPLLVAPSVKVCKAAHSPLDFLVALKTHHPLPLAHLEQA